MGHTHEDIDQKFSSIWTYIRDKYALSPQEYEQRILEAFKKVNQPVEVEDLFVIPNYKVVLGPHIDKKFSRWTKEEHTQLIWRVRFQPNANTPLNVETHYRAYARDKVFEIVNDSSNKSLLGVKAVKTYVSWYPAAQIMNQLEMGTLTESNGMFILTSFPMGIEIGPQEFVEGSRDALLKTWKHIQSDYPEGLSILNARINREWRDFVFHKAPQSDKALEHLEKCPLHVPFKDDLFRNQQVITYDLTGEDELNAFDEENLEHHRTTAHVRWSNRNKPYLDVPPRVRIDEEGKDIEGVPAEVLDLNTANTKYCLTVDQLLDEIRNRQKTASQHRKKYLKLKGKKEVLRARLIEDDIRIEKELYQQNNNSSSSSSATVAAVDLNSSPETSDDE